MTTGPSREEALPFIDEHTTLIEADVERVWTALAQALDGAFAGGLASAFARLVGCTDAVAAGPRPLEVGSTIPGFRVASIVHGRELVLEGAHRFSTYSLIFRLDELGPTRTQLRAESRATFPGVLGATYRALVIGTRGHVFGVRRLLAGVEHRSRA